MSLSFDQFIERVPERYRDKISLLGPFKGNRSRISFLNVGCGCEREYQLKTLLLRKSFEVCKWCIKKQNQKLGPKYFCKRCDKSFLEKLHFDTHNLKCMLAFDELVGKDYVVCKLCGFHSKKLAHHLRNKHGLNLSDYDGQIVCDNSKQNYSISAKKIKEAGLCVQKKTEMIYLSINQK